jgi:hypothetical protein
MTRFWAWLLVLLLVAAFAGATGYVLWLRAAAGKGMPDYSVYSEEADGLAEAARFLRRVGWEPVAVTRPVQNTNYQGLLILTEPGGSSSLGDDHELPEGDVKALLHWVEAGNTLLYGGRHATGLHQALGVVLVTDQTDTRDDPHSADLVEKSTYLQDVVDIVVEGKDQLETKDGQALWRIDGQPGAVVVERGHGRVIVIADPSVLTRRGLQEPDRKDLQFVARSEQDNAIFLYNVAWHEARGGKVYFDEYHHGLQSATGPWGYLAYYRAQWVLLPMLLLAGVAAWSVAVRLGPAMSLPEAARADVVDYASAVARIYERAGVRRIPARALVRGFLAALTRHLHLRRNALPAEILRAWQEQHPGESGKRLQALLRGVTALRKGDVRERQLLEWSQSVDAFQSEMMRAR